MEFMTYFDFGTIIVGIKRFPGPRQDDWCPPRPSSALLLFVWNDESIRREGYKDCITVGVINLYLGIGYKIILRYCPIEYAFLLVSVSHIVTSLQVGVIVMYKS